MRPADILFNQDLQVLKIDRALGDCVTIHPQYFTDRRQLDRGCSMFYHVFLRVLYYYSSKFARPAQIIWSGISPAKPQRRQGYGEMIKTLINDFHPQSPNFAPFASLREILRVSVAALPRCVLRGKSFSAIMERSLRRLHRDFAAPADRR